MSSGITAEEIEKYQAEERELNIQITATREALEQAKKTLDILTRKRATLSSFNLQLRQLEKVARGLG